MERSIFWDTAHERALSKLTADWQRFSLAAFGFINAFDDLVTWGHAEVKREPITLPGGVAGGEYIYFRRL